MYDEFWDAVVDLGLPPSFHILTSKTDNPFGEVRGPRLNTFMTVLRANPGHHRPDDLRRGVRTSSRAEDRVCGSRRGLGAALDVPAPITRTTATATG